MYTHAVHIPQFPYYTRKNRADKRLHCRTLQFEALEERDFLSVNAPILENGGIPDTSPWTNPAELHAPAETSSFVGNVEFPEAFNTENTGVSTISPVETTAEAARLDTVFAGSVPLRPVTVGAVSTGQDVIFNAVDSAIADFTAANSVSADFSVGNSSTAIFSAGNFGSVNLTAVNSAAVDFASADSAVMDFTAVDFILADSTEETTGGKIADEDSVVELLTELKEQTSGLNPTVVSKALAAWEPAMAALNLDLTGLATHAETDSSAPTEVLESQSQKTTSDFASTTREVTTWETAGREMVTWKTPTQETSLKETSSQGISTVETAFGETTAQEASSRETTVPETTVRETSTTGTPTTGTPISELEVLETSTENTMDLDGDPSLNAELKSLTTGSPNWQWRQWPYYDPLLDQNTFQYGAGIPTRPFFPGIPSGDTGGLAGFNGSSGVLALEIPGFSGYGNAYYLDIFRSSLPRTIWLYAMYFGDQVRVTPGPVNLARPVIDNTSASSVFGGYHIGGSVYFARIVDSKAYTTNAELMKRLEQEDRRERYEQFLKKEKEEFLNRTLKEQQKADEDEAEENLEENAKENARENTKENSKENTKDRTKENAPVKTPAAPPVETLRGTPNATSAAGTSIGTPNALPSGTPNGPPRVPPATVPAIPGKMRR